METFTLDNGTLKAVFLSYGAILHQLWVKDKKGSLINVIQGLSQPEAYLSDSWSRGAVIGRYAGRLENPITIEEKKIEIEHEKGVLLHSGAKGWNTQYWSPRTSSDTHLLTFEYECPEGTGGFPGTVNAMVSYRLVGNQLRIDYRATTDAPTHVNLTNHAYFNLNPKSAFASHQLQIHADRYLALKQNLVPTGTRLNVTQTPFDFRTPKTIATTRLDDYFVLNATNEAAATLYEPQSGIEMKTYTDQPGVVVFTTPHFEAICFETQKFSNTPNIPSFPSTLLLPEAVYKHQTQFEFNLKNEE